MSSKTGTEAITISQRLREETAGQHRAIEEARRFNRLGQEDFSNPEYVQLLARFYGFYKPLEAEFRKHSEMMGALDYERRFKLPLLEKDLKFFGLDDEALARLPVCGALPPTTTASEVIGTIYVMEGSTHGAQFITKRLRQQLALGEQGLAFYEGYGQETMPRWQEFKTYLDSTFAPDRDGDAVVASAVRTFEALHDWMNE
ncbi:MAG TPA: biliverdin-producing heme oxygenase [Coleofasciculaceae cyanobacterium]